MSDDPYCTATVNGRRCYAFRANNLTVCASHNPDRWTARRRATAHRRLDDLRRKRQAVAELLIELDTRIATLTDELEEPDGA